VWGGEALPAASRDVRTSRMRIRGQEAARALELPWGTQAGNSRERAESPARVRNTCTTHDASQWENRSSRSGLRGRRGWMVGAKTPRVRAGCAGGRARERSRTRRGASSQMGNSAPPTRESRFGRLGSLARPAPAHTPLVPPYARQGLHFASQISGVLPVLSLYNQRHTIQVYRTGGREMASLSEILQ
jgi:hypothetical protein